MGEGNIERHAVKRGEILRILKTEHPDFVSVKIVRNCLDNASLPTAEASLLSYLVYLEEKGYIKSTRKKGERSRISIGMVALTAKGLDLMDANNDLRDEGVSFL